MRFRLSTSVRTVALAGVLLSGVPASAMAPDRSGFDLNPGERIVAIDGVPVDSTAQAAGAAVPRREPATSQRADRRLTSRATAGPRNVVRRAAAGARNIVGTMRRTGRPFSYTPGSTALEKANHERRQNGYGALIPDPRLQQLALQKAKTAAARGQKNHVGGSLGGARAEGVGHTNGRFLSCCLDMPATYGGAAMVQGSDGWYCCLLVR